MHDDEKLLGNTSQVKQRRLEVQLTDVHRFFNCSSYVSFAVHASLAKQFYPEVGSLASFAVASFSLGGSMVLAVFQCSTFQQTTCHLRIYVLNHLAGNYLPDELLTFMTMPY